jgi:hypothetical protein
LNISGDDITFFTRTHPDSDVPPLRIFAERLSGIQLGELVSTTLANVQDVFLASVSRHKRSILTKTNDISSWRTLFGHFNNAKRLRISPGIEQDVRDILQPVDKKLSLILPTLEEIELNAIHPVEIDEKKQVSVIDPFQPFVDARQQAGHPLNVWWNTDPVPSGCSWEVEKWWKYLD